MSGRAPSSSRPITAIDRLLISDHPPTTTNGRTSFITELDDTAPLELLLTDHLSVDHKLSPKGIPNRTNPVCELPVDGILVRFSLASSLGPIYNQPLSHLQQHFGSDVAWWCR